MRRPWGIPKPSNQVRIQDAPSPKTNNRLTAEDSQLQEQSSHWEPQVLRRRFREPGAPTGHQRHRGGRPHFLATRGEWRPGLDRVGLDNYASRIHLSGLVRRHGKRRLTPGEAGRDPFGQSLFPLGLRPLGIVARRARDQGLRIENPERKCETLDETPEGAREGNRNAPEK